MVHPWTADSPHLVSCSAVYGVLSELADGPPMVHERSAPAQNGGTGHPWTYMPKSLSPPTIPHPHHQKLYLFLSQACGGDIKVKDFLAWFPDGPSTSPDSSCNSPSCPLGISLIPLHMFLDFIMKEFRVWGALIFF